MVSNTQQARPSATTALSATMRRAGPSLVRAVIAAPERIVFAFLSACLPVGLLVTFGEFRPALVIPGVVIFVVGLWRFVPGAYLRLTDDAGWETGRDVQRAAFGAAAAVVIAVAFVWVNRRYTGEWVTLARDPAFYTLRGFWLIHHPSAVVDIQQATQAASGVAGAQLGDSAFYADNGNLYIQGNGLLPALLAVAGWAFGLRGVLAGNLIIGAVGLLAVYCLGRRMIGSIWALVPTAALALSMPMVAFSRSPYSETVGLLGSIGGITVALWAWQSPRGRGWVQFFVGGLIAGVATLARVDGPLGVIGVLAGLGVVTLGARERATRSRAAQAATAFFAGAAVVIALSIVDGRINSPKYQSDLTSNIVPLLAAMVLGWILVVLVAVVPMSRWRMAIGRRTVRAARISGIVAAVAVVVMLLRPLFWTAHLNDSTDWVSQVSAMQKGSGLPIDGSRTYDESSINWLGLYFGWVAVVLAAIGVVILVWWLVRKREAAVAIPVMAFGIVALFELNDVNIFPDQIWAMRRFLPLIIPGFLLVITWLLATACRRWRGLTWLGALLGVVVMIWPAAPWGSNWSVAQYSGQLAEVDASCNAIANRPVVITGANPYALSYIGTFELYCGVPTVDLPTATPAALAQIRRQYHASQVVVVTFDPTSVTWADRVPSPVTTATMYVWTMPLQQAPTGSNHFQVSVWMGLLNADGRVSALPAGD